MRARKRQRAKNITHTQYRVFSVKNERKNYDIADENGIIRRGRKERKKKKSEERKIINTKQPVYYRPAQLYKPIITFNVFQSATLCAAVATAAVVV